MGWLASTSFNKDNADTDSGQYLIIDSVLSTKDLSIGAILFE